MLRFAPFPTCKFAGLELSFCKRLARYYTYFRASTLARSFKFGQTYQELLIPHCQPIASARIGCAQPNAGFLLNHDSLRVTQVARLGNKLMPPIRQSALRVS